MAPKYEELAALYFNHPEYAKKVVVAKVDATANDVPDDIAGFPTIKLFPAGSGEAVEYSGSRTVEDLASFIKESGKHGVDAYVTPAKDDDMEMPDADAMGKQAPAASKKAEEAKDKVEEKAGEAKGKVEEKAGEAKEKAGDVKEKVKSKVSDAAESVKSAVVGGDDDGIDNEIHDEL